MPVQRARLVLLVAGLLVIILSAMTFFAIQEKTLAQNAAATAIAQRDAAVIAQATAIAEKGIALSREIAANASAKLNDDPELSTLLAIEANRVSHTYEAEDVLRQAIPPSQLRTTLRGHTAWVYGAAFRNYLKIGFRGIIQS